MDFATKDVVRIPAFMSTEHLYGSVYSHPDDRYRVGEPER